MRANEDASNTNAVVVALPAADDPVHALGPEPSHVTLAYLGKPDDLDGEEVNARLAQVAKKYGPVTDNVSGKGTLGKDNAHVLHLDGEGTSQLRQAALTHGPILEAHQKADQFPTWNPHVTIGYPDEDDSIDQLAQPEKVRFDRIALWHGDQQTEHPLEGPMPEENTLTASISDQDVTVDPVDPVAWHGVWVVEGSDSGDRRTFAPNSLSNRELPLPLTWQKAAAPGHQGEVKVGVTTHLARVQRESDGKFEIRAGGLMLQNAEADEVVGEMAAFGRVGCSVGVDSATFSLDKTKPGPFGGAVTFSEACITNCTMVITGAFADAWITLGEAPEGFFGTADEPEPDREAVAVAAGELESFEAAVTAFRRGPGWVTDPVPTRRIHSYWTTPGQPGYAKIAWGTGGDFNRCRVEVGKYLAKSGDARFINQTCAQWHKDALGYYPSTHAKMLGKHASLDPLPMPTLVASGGSQRWVPKKEWFRNPELTEATLLQFEEHPEGTRVFGHLAEWGKCHLDFPGICVTPPPLSDSGRNFMIHRILTDDGIVFGGHITLGGGHADGNLTLHAAKEHYDNVSSVFADVVIGEDAVGIWFSGWLRPDHNNEEDRFKLFAAQLSGDWRDAGPDGMALIAAHAVVSPGFGIQPTVHVEDGRQVALVAAGGLAPRTQTEEINGATLDEIVAAGIAKYEERRAARERIMAAASAVGADPADRMARLREQIGD